ncbi:MAG: hypothetical protein ACRENP_01480 [Longimicrobiales bacterium]
MRWYVGPIICTTLLHGAMAAQNPPTWRLVEELRIGSVNDDAQTLAFIGALEVDARGNIYVTQPRTDYHIRVYDVSGKRVRTIGRKGGGPGEFEGIGNTVLRGDTLFAYDFQLRRTSLFGSDGRFVSSFSFTQLKLEPPFMSASPIEILGDGTVIAMPGAALRPDQKELRVPILRLDRQGQILDTILVTPRTNSTLSIQQGTVVLFTSQPFSDDPIPVVASGGTHVFSVDRRVAENASRAQFRITRVGVDGDTLWSRPYNYTARDLKSSTIDSNRVYATITDELDVPYVVRYRIQK